MFYDGRAAEEPGAIVCRVSPSFLRFGNFEIFAFRGEIDLLRQLADYTLLRHFPHLGKPGDDAYLAWFQEVCERTALMAAHWMRVGFVHGVMNTDNMSILGLTIDYGPYGWLDNFDPEWTPNTTDLPGRRYCYGRQPAIALWNLVQLAQALSPLMPGRVAELEGALAAYQNLFQNHFLGMMANKLGIEKLSEGDLALVQEMNELLMAAETDMTIFFRGLADYSPGEGLPAFLQKSFYGVAPEAVQRRWAEWLGRYSERLKREEGDLAARRKKMLGASPLYVPRNYLLQQAIEKAEAGDYSGVAELLEVFRRPYEEQPGKEGFAAKRPDWARDKPGCSTLSCSS
jgi:uncharacterized protein YdiU (UPF0061 family)